MLTQEQKETMIAALRGKSVAKENITEEYKKNLDLAEREEVKVTTSEGPVPCYIFTAKNRTKNCPVHINVHGGGFVRPHVLRDESTLQRWQMRSRESLWMWITAWLRSIRTRRHSTRPMKYADGYFPCWSTGMRTANAYPWEDTAQVQT